MNDEAEEKKKNTMKVTQQTDRQTDTDVIGAVVQNKFGELVVDTKLCPHLLNLSCSQTLGGNPCDLLELVAVKESETKGDR